MHENQIIPYHSSDLTGKRVLVFAPHPDDETLACGGSLCLHATAGDDIQVVVLTNGAAGDSEGQAKRDAYIALRAEETIKACEILGITKVVFLNFEDRALSGAPHALFRIISIIDQFQPELIYAPSAVDFHPDHRAAHFLICSAVKSSHHDFDIAFFEVNQLLNPNCIVDITKVSDRKYAAVDVYHSQLQEKNYKEICKGLNRFRSLTLAEHAVFAEAFFLINASVIRKSSFITVYQQTLQKLAPVLCKTGPLVSVIVRTKNRPELLTNALRSIVQQTYGNFEIVLVNDGGMNIQDVAGAVAGKAPIRYIDHKKSLGRAAAANAGLKAARGRYINFLDDDDILYPDHLEILINQCVGTDIKVVYSGIRSVFFDGSPGLTENRVHEEIQYNHDFDETVLLFYKYIPMMSVLFDRDILLTVPGFNESMEFFEDWDFWIRLSRCYRFYHVNKITAEYRFYMPVAQEAYWRDDIYLKFRQIIFKQSSLYVPVNAWIGYAQKILGRVSKPLQEKKVVSTGDAYLCHKNENTVGYNILTWRADEIKLVIQHVIDTVKLDYTAISAIKNWCWEKMGFIKRIVLKFKIFIGINGF